MITLNKSSIVFVILFASSVALSAEPEAANDTNHGGSEAAPSSSPSSDRAKDEEQDDGKLFPPTANNPSFPFLAKTGEKNGRCAGTLVSAVSGRCQVITAAHCFDTSEKVAQFSSDGVFRAFTNAADALTQSATEAPTEQKSESASANDVSEKNKMKIPETATVKMHTFGEVTAKLIVGQDTGRKDALLFEFECDNNKAKFPVVATDFKQELKDKQRVFYSKTMVPTKRGLHKARVRRQGNVVSVNGFKPGAATEETLAEDPSKKIQQGDSGGGLFVKRWREGGRAKGRKNFDWVLVGVLSTSGDISKNEPVGNYAVKESMSDIAKQIRTPRPDAVWDGPTNGVDLDHVV